MDSLTLPQNNLPVEPQAQDSLTLPETSAPSEPSPFSPPQQAEPKSDWLDEAPGSFLDPPEHPDEPTPDALAEPQPAAERQPATIPQPRSGSITPPAQADQPALAIGSESNGTKKGKRRSGSKSSGLPTAVKFAIPVVLLAGIAGGAIKFWPTIQSKLGMGPDTEEQVGTDLPNSTTSTQPNRNIEDDPSGFEMIDTPPGDSPMKKIEPHPQAHIGTHQPEDLDPIQPSPEIDLDPEPDQFPIAAVEPEKEDGADVKDMARELLDKVLAAESVDELAKYVLDPERVRPLMEEYYRGKSPALQPQSIIYDQATPIRDEDGFRIHTFFMSTSAQPMRFPVGVEETSVGLKFDWESFTELHDDLLGKFLASPTSDPGTFRVLLARAHYFDTDVPKLGSKDCFRITTPIAGTEGFAFVDKDSDLGAECKKFEWDTVPYFPIVELQWTTPPSGGKPYLEITKCVRDSWRSTDPAPEL